MNNKCQQYTTLDQVIMLWSHLPEKQSMTPWPLPSEDNGKQNNTAAEIKDCKLPSGSASFRKRTRS